MLDSSPMTQFGRWFSEAAAAGLPEPNAMVLTTVGDRPHARTVLLKAHDAAGFTFYTNRTSRKGQDLAGNPSCCAIFPWYGLGRQVIIEGVASPLSQADSEPYFHSRALAVADRRLGVAPVAGAGVAGGPRRPGGEALGPLAGGDRGADARLLGRVPDRP